MNSDGYIKVDDGLEFPFIDTTPGANNQIIVLDPLNYKAIFGIYKRFNDKAERDFEKENEILKEKMIALLIKNSFIKEGYDLKVEVIRIK